MISFTQWNNKNNENGEMINEAFEPIYISPRINPRK